MPLTGWQFFWLLAVLTIGVFATVVWFLPRFSARNIPATAARTGMILGLNALVLLTTGAALNDQYAFFADWTDLRGALFGGEHATTSQAGWGPRQAADVGVTRKVALPKPAGPGPVAGAPVGQRVVQFSVTGAVSGVHGTIAIGLPADYNTKGTATRQYPVLEAFGGYPASVTQWFDSMGVLGAIDTAVGKHEMSEAVVVSATTEVPPGVDTECTNGDADAPKMETWVTQDVPRWVEHHLRVRTDRASWTTIGLSEGGWCAAMGAMLHPDQYGAGVVLGGYFKPLFPGNKPPYAKDGPLAKRYDLVSLAQNRPPPVAIWVQTSHSDDLSYPSTSAMVNAAKRPLSVTTVELEHGGHRISLWQGYLPSVLHWLGGNIAGFAP